MLDVEVEYKLSLDPETGAVTVVPITSIPIKGYTEPPWIQKRPSEYLHDDPSMNRARRAGLAGIW